MAALIAAQLSVYCKLFHMSAVVKQPEQAQGTITTQDAREEESRGWGNSYAIIQAVVREPFLNIFMNLLCKPNRVNEYTPTEEMQ